MENFPPVGTVVCGCDEDAACRYHAGMLYGKEHYAPVLADTANAHVAPVFRDILAEMIIEARTNPMTAKAIDVLYGREYAQEYMEQHYNDFAYSGDPDVERLAKVDPREVYNDDDTL
jgi:hypothetical protein